MSYQSHSPRNTQATLLPRSSALRRRQAPRCQEGVGWREPSEELRQEPGENPPLGWARQRGLRPHRGKCGKQPSARAGGRGGMRELCAVPVLGKRGATNQWRNIQPAEKYAEQTSENLPGVRTGGGRREEGARARRHWVFRRRGGMSTVGILWVRPFPPDLPGPPMIHSTTGGFRANCIGAASPRARSQEGIISPNTANPQNACGDTPGKGHPSPTGVHHRIIE